MAEPSIVYIPQDYLDEIVPAGRASPTDWLTTEGNTCRLAAAFDDEDSRPGDPLADGQIVQFVSKTDYGTANLILKDDGTHSVDIPMPAEAEQLCAMNGWQLDTLAVTVDECASLLRDAEADPGDYELAYYTYSGDIAFRFAAATASFERVQ